MDELILYTEDINELQENDLIKKVVHLRFDIRFDQIFDQNPKSIVIFASKMQINSVHVSIPFHFRFLV